MEFLSIMKTLTAPLHPHFADMVDRHNRTINSYLSLFVLHNQQGWDKLVHSPKALNTKQQDTLPQCLTGR